MPCCTTSPVPEPANPTISLQLLTPRAHVRRSSRTKFSLAARWQDSIDLRGFRLFLPLQQFVLSKLLAQIC